MGIYIRAHVTTSAKKEKIIKNKELEYEISVREKAERNMANRRVRELIAFEFGISYGAVRIVNGHHSGIKLLKIENDNKDHK